MSNLIYNVTCPFCNHISKYDVCSNCASSLHIENNQVIWYSTSRGIPNSKDRFKFFTQLNDNTDVFFCAFSYNYPFTFSVTYLPSVSFISVYNETFLCSLNYKITQNSIESEMSRLIKLIPFS